MTKSITSFSKSERYMAFLLAYWAKLSAYALYAGEGMENGWKEAVYDATLAFLEGKRGLNLEFGVYKGFSINRAAEAYPGKTFYGFDSFEGFPEDGRTDWRGDYSVPALPEVRDNVVLTKGWFADTLPSFLKEHDEEIAFINIDCDIYSSTHDIFNILAAAGKLKPGVICYFDELLNYGNFWRNEARALFEMLEATGLGIEWIACHHKVRTIEEALILSKERKGGTISENARQGYGASASLVLTDGGIDYTILSLPHVERRVKRLAKMYEALSS